MDKPIFQAIRQLESEKRLDLDELLSEGRIRDTFNYMAIVDLARSLGWRRQLNRLVMRIQTFMRNHQNMSFRESKLLSKLILRDYRDNTKINYEVLLIQFPGKTIETLKDAYSRILERRKKGVYSKELIRSKEMHESKLP